MARKKKPKISMSEQVRRYMAKNPTAKAGEIADACGVPKGLVYNVKAIVKKKTGRPATPTSSRVSGLSGVYTLAQIRAAKKLTRELGLKEAKDLMEAVND